ncbi:hypothetical protein PENFLA_c004G00947 [Penicillium flavigenum]|uniref:Amino acid permease/ SLC12A domain-containing protein n=1 Tax=Penicillium flavigenum TaxID=254877 RepID=A0A1V6TT22_9EURO|nr:hypothetical protein PENFLA_c004G00947 [Penicillium flavigenum]
MTWRRSFKDCPAAVGTVVDGQTEQEAILRQRRTKTHLALQLRTTRHWDNSVGPVTITLLNITMMIGAGIYSTPSSILSGTDSVGVSLIYWTLGYLICLTSGAVYLEFTAYFPSRSGSEVVFLEQAYPNPKFLFLTTFAVQSVILSFGSANATVMAKYLIAISGYTGTDWQIKGTALACYSLATLTLVFNTKYAYCFSNAVGIGGNTIVENPTANFQDAWSGSSTASAYGFTTALCRIIFSYGGYNNAFNVANEVKNAVKSVKIYATIALTTVYVLYMFANIAFFAAEDSDLTTASLFFEKVFGNSGAVHGLNFLIALASVAVPAGDAFTFVNDLNIIPSAAFNLSMALGIYVVRWRRSKANLPEPEFKAWNFVILFNILVQLYLLVMPWYPATGGQYADDVSFWYATYAVTGIGILLACGIYYYAWAFLIPKWRGYEPRQELLYLGGGAQKWDATHDAAGRLIESPVEIQVQAKGTDMI